MALARIRLCAADRRDVCADVCQPLVWGSRYYRCRPLMVNTYPCLRPIIIWLVLSAIFLVAWFKFIRPLSVDRTKAGLGGSVIIGETGMIIVAPQLERAGVVRFSVPIVGAAEWMCRTSGEQVAVGDRVIVTDIVGNELIVSSMQAQAVINKNS